MTTRGNLAYVAGVLRRDNAPAAHEHAAGISSYLSGEAPTLEAALGLVPPPVDLARRDRLIAAAATRQWPGHRPAAQARFLEAALLRYAAGPWRWEQIEASCPPARVGLVEELFWEMLRSAPDVPSQRTIRRILATGGSNGQKRRATSKPKEKKQ